MTEMKNVFRLNKLGKAFSISDNVHLIYVWRYKDIIWSKIKLTMNYTLYYSWININNDIFGTA